MSESIELYRPSNGTEGEYFMGKFCANCVHEKFMHTQDDDDAKCDVLSRTMIYDTQEPEYPREWRYDANDKPHCTKFRYWDWGRDDGRDLNEPPEAPVDDPNQLVLPLLIEEVITNCVEAV